MLLLMISLPLHCLLYPKHHSAQPTITMSQSGPPADAKQAQAAALQELEAAQKRKRAIDTSLVSPGRRASSGCHNVIACANMKFVGCILDANVLGKRRIVYIRLRKHLPGRISTIRREHHQGGSSAGVLSDQSRSVERGILG